MWRTSAPADPPPEPPEPPASSRRPVPIVSSHIRARSSRRLRSARFQEPDDGERAPLRPSAPSAYGALYGGPATALTVYEGADEEERPPPRAARRRRPRIASS